MQNCGKWMIEYHSWPGISHNILNLFSSIRCIAMDFTCTAEGFCLHKWTLPGSFCCVIQQLSAFFADGFSLLMISAAIDLNHELQHSLLLCSFFIQIHLEYPPLHDFPVVSLQYPFPGLSLSEIENSNSERLQSIPECIWRTRQAKKEIRSEGKH